MIESGTSPAPVAQWTECLTSNQLVARSNRAGGILLGFEPPGGGKCRLVARSNRAGGILLGLEPPAGGRCQLVARSNRAGGILLGLEPPEGGKCQLVARSNRAGGILLGLEPPEGGRCPLVARSNRAGGILFALEPPAGGRCQLVARSNRAGGSKSYITLTGNSFSWYALAPNGNKSIALLLDRFDLQIKLIYRCIGLTVLLGLSVVVFTRNNCLSILLSCLSNWLRASNSTELPVLQEAAGAFILRVAQQLARAAHLHQLTFLQEDDFFSQPQGLGWGVG